MLSLGKFSFALLWTIQSLRVDVDHLPLSAFKPFSFSRLAVAMNKNGIPKLPPRSVRFVRKLGANLAAELRVKAVRAKNKNAKLLRSLRRVSQTKPSKPT